MQAWQARYLAKAEAYRAAGGAWPPPPLTPVDQESLGKLISMAHAWDTAQAAFARAEPNGDLVEFRAFLTLALIELKDLMVALDKLGLRVDVRGPLICAVRRGDDLHELIGEARNVACHADAAHSQFDTGETSGSIRWMIIGPGAHIQLGDQVVANETTDDLMVTFGALRLYLRSNVALAVVLCREKILELAAR